MNQSTRRMSFLQAIARPRTSKKLMHCVRHFTSIPNSPCLATHRLYRNKRSCRPKALGKCVDINLPPEKRQRLGYHSLKSTYRLDDRRMRTREIEHVRAG